MGGNRARLISPGDGPQVDNRRTEHGIASSGQGRDELVFHEMDEMGRRRDGIETRLRRSAVGGPSLEIDLQPLQTPVADVDPIAGRFADDGPVGLEPVANELLGPEAFHFFVDNAGQGDPARGGLPGVLQGHQGPGHGGQSALHIHSPPPVETAVFFGRGKRVFGVSLVGWNRIHVAAEEKVRTGPSPSDRSQKVRPPFADFLIVRLDAAGLKKVADLPGDGLLLARHPRI